MKKIIIENTTYTITKNKQGETVYTSELGTITDQSKTREVFTMFSKHTETNYQIRTKIADRKFCEEISVDWDIHDLLELCHSWLEDQSDEVWLKRYGWLKKPTEPTEL